MSGLPHVSLGSVLERCLLSRGDGVLFLSSQRIIIPSTAVLSFHEEWILLKRKKLAVGAVHRVLFLLTLQS